MCVSVCVFVFFPLVDQQLRLLVCVCNIYVHITMGRFIGSAA